MENIKEDLQKLINHCYSTAERLLSKQKEFYPFGAYINNAKKLIPTGFYDGDEFPLSETLITGLKNYFVEKIKKKKISAYAITFDTKVTNSKYPDSIDAICIQIFHQNSDDINYYFPYKILNKQINFFESWGEVSK